MSGGIWRALRTSFALNRPRNIETVELVSAGMLGGGRAAYRPSALLAPARPLFIWGSLLVALALNLLPVGPTSWLPDFLALALVFWNVHQPRRVGIGAAFVFGLLMDVHDGALVAARAGPVAGRAVRFACRSAVGRRRLPWLGLLPDLSHRRGDLAAGDLDPAGAAEALAGTRRYPADLAVHADLDAQQRRKDQ